VTRVPRLACLGTFLGRPPLKLPLVCSLAWRKVVPCEEIGRQDKTGTMVITNRSEPQGPLAVHVEAADVIRLHRPPLLVQVEAEGAARHQDSCRCNAANGPSDLAPGTRGAS
jgi:hypothetical protein